MSAHTPRSRPQAAALVSALVVLSLGLPARAQDETQVDVTQTLTVEYRIDNQNGRLDDDDYGTIINRTNLSATAGDISTQLRLDGSGFFEPPTGAFRDDLRLERLSVEYSLGDWTLTGGDFFQQLGRGIALSIRKVNEVAFDIALRGGRLTWEGDDHQVLVFAGRVNPANFDNVSQRFIQDPEDIVTGGLYEFYGWDAATLGAFALYMQPDERFLPSERDWVQGVGLYLDGAGLTDWLSLYVEGDFQRRKFGPLIEEGQAAYLNATASLGDATLLLEGIYLDAFEIRGGTNTALGSRFFYNQTPTLERIDQEVLNTRDVQGARAQLEYLFVDLDLSVYANTMYRLTDPDLPNETRQTHHYLGFNWNYQGGLSRIGAIGGRRDEVLLIRPDDDFKTLNDFQLDYVQHLSGPYGLHLMSWNEFRTLEGRAYRRGSTFLGLEVTGLGSFTLEYGFDTQNPSPDIAQHFFAGILAWKLDDALELRATGGTQRGGLKCIAGVCREFPGFAGARVEAIGRF